MGDFLAGFQNKSECIGLNFDSFKSKNIKKAYFFGEAKDILFKLYGEEIVCKKFSKMQDAFLQSFKESVKLPYCLFHFYQPVHYYPVYLG